MGFTYKNSRGQTYCLNTQDSEVKGGRIFTHHFFTPNVPSPKPKAKACDLPAGMEVVENPRNGFPVLRKKR